MLSSDFIKKISEDMATNRKSEKTDSRQVWKEEGRKAAAKKLMAALREDNSDQFLEAYTELGNYNGDDATESD